MLDSSGSIGSAPFELAKQFVEQLANAFTVYAPSRFAFITYSNAATVHINIDNVLTRGAISSTILSNVWEAGGTATDLGIALGAAVLTSPARSVPLNMVVLTDGVSNSPSATIAAAQAAIGLGIRTFSVGINNYNLAELLAIAGNDAGRVFTETNFDDLIQLLAPLSLKVCPT